MLTFKKLTIPGFEEVLQAESKEDGFLSLIAIHNTKRGQALGGIRFYPYKNEKEALFDVLRLAEAMTYKTSLAKLSAGGGKSVIIGDPEKPGRDKMLALHAEALNYLEGRYFGAGDVGTTMEDMKFLAKKTPYVVGTGLPGKSGEPSPFTAWGTFLGLQAVGDFLFGSPSLKGKRIAIQGLGKVGFKLAEFLFWQGAYLTVSDMHQKILDDARHYFSANICDPEKILEVPCDILCPCALGGILNKESIAKLACRAVAGAANNQLLDDESGELLFKRGILYAPDFAINAGGVINCAKELDPKGYSAHAALEDIEKIPKVLKDIFEESLKKGIPQEKIAEEKAKKFLSLMAPVI